MRLEMSRPNVMARMISISTLASLCIFVQRVQAKSVLQPVEKGPGFSRYNMVVSMGRGAPDCFARNLVLVNGMESPTIEIESGSWIYVNVINKIPDSFPSVYEGISIHWHGFNMHGKASWYDGVPYVDQCPIAPGTNFTYAFKVEETPGTYFWHDHSFAWKGDGLSGPLIVRPPAGTREPFDYDEEFIMYLSDWWHTESNIMAMRLNRPFDPSKVNANTGAWAWVGNPQAILINGKGFYGDCQLHPGSGAGLPPACNASVFTVLPGRSKVQPWAEDTNPGCTHESFIVEQGKTYRFRIIGSTEQLYTTTCFEGHDVTVIAADAIPIEPFNVTCVDVNVGQRMDVLLTANQPSGNYWISVQQQYRTGSPSGFAVLTYKEAPKSTFPVTPTPQPTVNPWSLNFVNQMKLRSELLTLTSEGSPWALYQQHGSMAPPQVKANRNIMVEISQPLLNSTGVLRWALNNVITQTTPCEPIRGNIKKDKKWLQKLAAGLISGASQQLLNKSQGNSSPLRATVPTVGIQVVEITEGDIIDVVLQNSPANAFNGDYTPAGPNRTAQEQHPFHLHGYHFWVLGSGLGVYDPGNMTMINSLNLKDPIMRDTVTVPQGGWVIIRFEANNPGVWPLHCHILWHHFMGQQLYFVESPSAWPPQPKQFPKCPKTCMFNNNPFTKSFVEAKYGYSGFPLP